VVYLVSYTLRGYRPRADYIRVENVILGISGTYFHSGESRWFVETELSSKQIADRLAPYTLVGDQILVFRVHRDWAGYSLTAAEIEWLQARSYSSVWEMLANLAPLPVPKPVTTGLAAALAAFGPTRRGP
jgi:hypothetical protein